MKLDIDISEIGTRILRTIMVLVSLCLIGAAIVFISAHFMPVEAQDRVSHVDGPYIPRRPLTAPQAPVGPKTDSTVTIGRISSLQSAETDTIRLRTYQSGNRTITTGRVGNKRIFLEERSDSKSN